MPHDKARDYILGAFPGLFAGGILLFGDASRITPAAITPGSISPEVLVLIIEYPVKLLMTAACGVVSTLAINVAKDWYKSKGFFKPKK